MATGSVGYNWYEMPNGTIQSIIVFPLRSLHILLLFQATVVPADDFGDRVCVIDGQIEKDSEIS